MQNLFETEIIIDGEPKGYQVHFENDAYQFTPLREAPAFFIKRENDRFYAEGPVNDIAKDQAISSLQGYLLSQH